MELSPQGEAEQSGLCDDEFHVKHQRPVHRRALKHPGPFAAPPRRTNRGPRHVQCPHTGGSRNRGEASPDPSAPETCKHASEEEGGYIGGNPFGYFLHEQKVTPAGGAPPLAGDT